MKNVIIWGIGIGYEALLNNILFEVKKENICIKALVCKKDDKYCDFKDGYPIILKDDIKDYDYDYVIITSTKYFSEICKEAVGVGIECKKLINAKFFSLPKFDFLKYVSLIENPVTILANDCWGALYTID